jgi:deoxyribonuclease V
MEFPDLHTWSLGTREARDLQSALACQVDTCSRLGDWALVAAADISYNKRDPRLYAAVVVMEASTSRVVERVGMQLEARFLYVPGLLSFRESPAVLEVFRRIQTRPDVLLCDGQGIAHPRRMGLACHLGLWLGIPTIGCAKSRLCGEFETPGPARGDRSPLIDYGETIGVVLRTRARVKPLFVSVGHRCDLESAVDVVLATATKYRLPEVARFAHNEVNSLRSSTRVGSSID